MTKPDLISIVMPVQNTELYLEECINSILGQSYTSWELIAVDDHSTDSSFEILKRYAIIDSRIRSVKSHGHNILAALQTGYELCKGAYICRMDSDDVMHSRKLELLKDKLDQLPKQSVAAGSVHYFTESGEVGDGYNKYSTWLNGIAKTGSYWTELYRECVIPSCCWLMKMDEFESVGGFNGATYPEDYDFCFRLYKNKYRVFGIENRIHLWRDRNDRASRTKAQYADNRFLALKATYFHELDFDSEKSLILWGAGRNGKDLAKELTQLEINFQWISDNAKKIGKHIYDIKIESTKCLETNEPKQVLIAVSNETEKLEIKTRLESLSYQQAQDFWFFL